MGFTSRRIVSQRAVGTMDGLIADHALRMGDAGVVVTAKTAAGLPAFDAGINFAANAVAQLTAKVYRGEGPVQAPVTTTWQARLFRGAPSSVQDWFTFWYIVEASRTARRNAYIWKTLDSAGQVVALTALHPDQVWPYRTVGSPVQYGVTFSPAYPCPPEVEGFGSLSVDSSRVHHIRGPGSTGEVIAPSPIDTFKAALGLSVAKQQHESSLFRNGAQGGLVVTFPPGVTKAQADVWREGFDSEHSGVGNSGSTKVAGNGATVTQIGMSQTDAQFIQSVQLSIQDIALILNVPSWMLGAERAQQKATSPEHEMQRWSYFHLHPRLAAIESSLNADPDLFGSGIDALHFDQTNVIQGDLLTEADISIRKVQAGIWLPDEARARDSLGPLPDGKGQIPQVTPVGGAPNSPAVAPPAEGGTEDE